MNLIASAPSWRVVILLAALAAAAIEDAIRLKISNATCLVVLVTALIAMGLRGFPLDLWQNALVFVALLAAGTPLFATGKVGGGDVKLLACLGLWFSIGTALWLIVLVFIAGGILALAFLATRMVRKKSSKSGIPYGLAIAAGGLLLISGQLGWLPGTSHKANPFAVRVPG